MSGKAVKRAYKFRFYPTPQQTAELNRTFGCVRYVWNWALDSRTKRYRTAGERVNYHQLSAELTGLKRDPQTGFLREVAYCPLQQVLRHQQTAFGNFFAKRARYPRFKSRHGRQSAEYTRKAFRWRNGQLWLSKMDTPLDIRVSRPAPDGDPSTVTVSRDTDGRWHVSMLFDDTVQTLTPAGTCVGVDLGIKDFAVLSTGEKIPNPKHLDRKARNLARYQRRLARCQKGSANRRKAKAKVARAHRKVRNARTDFLHKTSTRLVHTHDTIAVEDLAVKNMVRNRRLARSISDCGWGEFRRQLEYKANWYGRTVAVIDRWHPSSKLCSTCGHLLAELSLSTRTWQCPSCRTRHDRDINAAKNILAEGLSVTACGGDVRHSGSSRVQSPMKQEPSRATGRIPALKGGE